MAGKRAKQDSMVQVERKCRVEVLDASQRLAFNGAPIRLQLTNAAGNATDDWYFTAEVATRIRDQLSGALAMLGVEQE